MSEWRRVKQTGKRDRNEPEIVSVFEEDPEHYTVHKLADPADLLVGAWGHTHLVEVKFANEPLTPAQVKFRETWKGEPPETVRSKAQARALKLRWDTMAAWEAKQPARVEYPVDEQGWTGTSDDKGAA